MNARQVEIAKMNIPVRNALQPTNQILTLFLRIAGHKKQLPPVGYNRTEKLFLGRYIPEVFGVLNTYYYHIFRNRKFPIIVDKIKSPLQRQNSLGVPVYRCWYRLITIHQKTVKSTFLPIFRITSYSNLNSPFHIIRQQKPTTLLQIPNITFIRQVLTKATSLNRT